MNTKKIFVCGIFAVILALSLTGCPEPEPEHEDQLPVPRLLTYYCVDSDGNVYTLEITDNTGRYAVKQGDSFKLTVEGFNNGDDSVALTYSGTIESVNDSGTEIEIGVTVNGKPLTITISGIAITVINGTIVLDNDEERTITEPLKYEPEDFPVAKRWRKWIDDDAVATLDHFSVDSDGVCTITIGGKAQANDETDGWGGWKVIPHYNYTAETNTCYAYKFEAWTRSGSRTLNVQYYGDNDEEVYLGNEISLTNERKTYTIYGNPIPKGGVIDLGFHCANQLGTFYVKILSITPITAADRWDKWIDDTSTATLDYSVDSDDVCTITVGGQPDAHWKTDAQYKYTASANNRYAYVFEAWTQSGERDLTVRYYHDNEGNQLYTNLSINSTRKTYTIYGDEILRDGLSNLTVNNVTFQCANQTGTFYVKVLEIKPYGLWDLSIWTKWFEDDSTATLDYFVDSDDVCTITVGGQPDNRWKAEIDYHYTASANTKYAYVVEAWTRSGTRNLDIQYYDEDGIALGTDLSINSTRQTYTIRGKQLPKGGDKWLRFPCADQTGTFYMKLVRIYPY